jgi:diadenosine tetraphosphate (Ap4A) HIT family hydrolase
MSCVFCELPENRIIEKSSLSKVFRDAFPVTPLHTLIIPIQHVSDYFDLSQEEKADIENLLVKQKKHIMELDENVCGFNVGINIGETAGQTVFHAHVHLIPRRKGDVNEPRGGIRGVIPERQTY